MGSVMKKLIISSNDTTGGARPCAQATADAFCFICHRVAASVNGDSTLGARFHTNAAGNAHLTVYNSQLLHKFILSEGESYSEDICDFLIYINYIPRLKDCQYKVWH